MAPGPIRSILPRLNLHYWEIRTIPHRAAPLYLLNACKALQHSPPIPSKMCKSLSSYCWEIMALIWWLAGGGLSAGTLSSEGSLTGCCWGWECWQHSSGQMLKESLCLLPYHNHNVIPWNRHWNNTKMNKGPWNSFFKPEFGIWRRK